MMVLRPILTAVACTLATALSAENFSLDTDYATGMGTLGQELLIDAAIGTPVYIGAYELCEQNGDLFALGLARVTTDDILIGLLEVTRQENGSVAVVIPEIEDPYGDDFLQELAELGAEYVEEYASDLEEYDPFYEDDRLVTLWSLLQGLPCGDWGALTADPATLLPVASIDGKTSMSALLETYAATE